VEKKQYDLFLEILRRFQKSGLLDDVILIGSWTIVFYKAYFKGFERLKRYALVTRDLDFLVDYPHRVKGRVDIPQLLENLGFVVSFVGSEGYIHLVHPDLIVEFLTPERGPGVDGPVPLKNWGMNATALRFLDFLVKDKIAVVFEGINVVLPHPARFGIHKLVVAQRRTNKDKARKDNLAAVDILNDLIDAGQEDKVVSVYKEFSLPWQKKIVAALKGLDAGAISAVLENKG
jgi:hypothetical protein